MKAIITYFLISFCYLSFGQSSSKFGFNLISGISGNIKYASSEEFKDCVDGFADHNSIKHTYGIQLFAEKTLVQKHSIGIGLGFQDKGYTTYGTRQSTLASIQTGGFILPTAECVAPRIPNCKRREDCITGKYIYQYFTLPVYFKYHQSTKVYFKVGLQAEMLKSKSNQDIFYEDGNVVDTKNLKRQLKTPDNKFSYSMLFGTGYNFLLTVKTAAFVEPNLGIQLRPLSKNQMVNTHLWWLQLTVGIQFNSNSTD